MAIYPVANPKDGVVLSGKTFNTMTRAINASELIKQVGTFSQQRRKDCLLVRNTTNAVIPQFGVVGIGGVSIAPHKNRGAFSGQIILDGIAPGAAHFGWFVIALDPIQPNTLGKAVGSGFCQARVHMIDENHKFADVDPGTTSQLKSSAFGSAQLLWIEPQENRVPTSVAWTIVRLGGILETTVLARITAHTQVGSKARWVYDWVEGVRGVDGEVTTKEGGLYGLAALNTGAYNVFEDANVTQRGGVQGDGVDQTASGYQETSYKMIPIGGGDTASGPSANVVSVHLKVRHESNGVFAYEFGAMNAHDGACE